MFGKQQGTKVVPSRAKPAPANQVQAKPSRVTRSLGAKTRRPRRELQLSGRALKVMAGIACFAFLRLVIWVGFHGQHHAKYKGHEVTPTEQAELDKAIDKGGEPEPGTQAAAVAEEIRQNAKSGRIPSQAEVDQLMADARKGQRSIGRHEEERQAAAEGKSEHVLAVEEEMRHVSQGTGHVFTEQEKAAALAGAREPASAPGRHLATGAPQSRQDMLDVEQRENLKAQRQQGQAADN